MITVRTAGVAVAALLGAILVVPAMADGASDFQNHAKQAQSTLDQLSALVDNVHNRQASAAPTTGTQQVADTEDTMKCPACGMMMTAKATGGNTKAVTIKGKTYYCCAGCNMSKYADKPAANARQGRRRGGRRPAAKPNP